MGNSQHWMHRDRTSKPPTLSAQLATVTAERDALLKRLEAAEACAKALEAQERLWTAHLEMVSGPFPPKLEAMMDRYDRLVQVKKKQALAAWRAADGG